MDPGSSPAPDENIANSINAVKVILFINNEYDLFHTVLQELNLRKLRIAYSSGVTQLQIRFT